MLNKIRCIALVPVWNDPAILRPCKVGEVIELEKEDYDRKLKKGFVKPFVEPKPEPKQTEQAITPRKAGNEKNARSKKN